MVERRGLSPAVSFQESKRVSMSNSSVTLVIHGRQGAVFSL